MPLLPRHILQPGDHDAYPHREQREPWPLFNACVARTLSRKEISERKDAQAALKLEGDTLAAKAVWILQEVMERTQ